MSFVRVSWVATPILREVLIQEVDAVRLCVVGSLLCMKRWFESYVRAMCACQGSGKPIPQEMLDQESTECCRCMSRLWEDDCRYRWRKR